MTPRQHGALVSSVDPWGHLRRVRLEAPPLGARLQPGQFITADLGDVTRRPLLPAAIDHQGVELLLPLHHPVTRLNQGDEVDLLGPLGRPLPLPSPPTRLLLAADSQRLPALLPFTNEALKRGVPVALFLSAPTSDRLYPLSLLPPSLEIYTATADGSAGKTGSLADPSTDLLTWAGRMLVAGDRSLYPTLAEAVRQARLGLAEDFAQALVLPTIVCGVGACQGCAVSTRRGYHLACTEGPFFDLLTLEAL
jgi:dihydroorotate dehydrogenase electron transfer subunit